MSITTRPSPADGKIQITIEKNLSDELPNDIWKIILPYLATSAELPHLTSMALVSKQFFEICLPSFTKLRIQNAFGILSRLSHKSLDSLQTTLIPLQMKMHGRQRLLTVDSQGRQYMCSAWGYYHHILFVMEPSSLQFISLDLVEAMKSESVSHGSQIGQKIISCHSTHEGFIVVTSSGYSKWKYEEGKPIFQYFSSPFKSYERRSTQIEYSAFQEGKLLLQGCGFSSKTLLIKDVENQDSPFFPLTTSGKLSSVLGQLDATSNSIFFIKQIYLHNQGKNPCLIFKEGEQVCCLKVQATETDSAWEMQPAGHVFRFPGHLSNANPPISSCDWTLHFELRNDCILLYVIKQGKVWIGEDMNLRLSRMIEHDTYFIYEDFLFLSDSTGDFRLIYLPTKKEYALECKKVLKNYLESKEATLYFLSMTMVHQDEAELNLLFQTKNKHDDELMLHALKIPLKASLLANFEESKQLMEKGNGSSSNQDQNQSQEQRLDVIPITPQEPSQSEVNSQTSSVGKLQKRVSKGPKNGCLADKVTFIVGAILFILVAAASLTLILLHPGTVIYKGSNVILTLPALLTLSIGGPAALIIIAIGSYQWWKNSQQKNLPKKL